MHEDSKTQAMDLMEQSKRQCGLSSLLHGLVMGLGFRKMVAKVNGFLTAQLPACELHIPSEVELVKKPNSYEIIYKFLFFLTFF